MDPALLAQTLTIFLSPTLPYLAKAGEKALEEAGKKLGAGTAEKAAEIWRRLRPAVDAKPAAADAAADVAQDPDDEDLKTALRGQLRKILARDPELAAALASLLEGVRIRGGDHLELHGSGAIAHRGGTAAGAGGVAVAGDVHGPVVIHPPAPAPVAEPDPATPLRNSYLSWVMESAGYLTLGGIDPAVPGRDAETRLRLGAVYTALGTRTPRQLGEGDDGEPPRHPRERADERTLSAVEQLDRTRRLVLLGDPGSGKSTFLSFVALCLAGEALTHRDANLELLTAPLPEKDGRDAEERQRWETGWLLPVRVVLRDFAARGLAPDASRAAARDLWRFVAADLEEHAQGAFVPQLERELRDPGGLVLLDGLDEVPEEARRRRLICRAVEDFAQCFPRCRVVVTSRPYAYEKQDFRLPGFTEARLEPFGPGQIRRFVHRWYAHVAPYAELRPEQAERRAGELERAIFASPHLEELAGRPLLLTLMASLHSWRGGSLPEERAGLYEDTVQLLLDFWERQRETTDAAGRPVVQPSLAEWLEADRKRVRQVLEELAFEAHGTQPELVGTADLDQGELVKRLLLLREESPERDPLKLVDYLSQRAGLLEPRGVGVYTFPHRTFQEYLAACHLSSGRFDEDAVAGLGREDPGRWREVVLLAAARWGAGIWHLVEALCEPGGEETALGRPLAWGARLAAQAVVEAGAGDRDALSPRHWPRLDRLRGLLAQVLASGHLPAAERALAGDDLARLGDPRFDPTAWFLPAEPSLGFVKIPGGTFTLGRDPQHSVELTPFYLARHPVTVAQFRAFVEDAGYQVEGPRALAGLPNHPVVRVSWYDAMAYCRWLSAKLPDLGRRRLAEAPPGEPWLGELWQRLAAGELVVTLPSEAQWEAAARGTDARRYPWGNEAPAAEKANFGLKIGGTTAVGIYPQGAGPYGTLDQAGNVWEWCRDVWDENAYAARDGQRDPLSEGESAWRVLRGGAWWGPATDLAAACRDGDDAAGRDRNFGFRCLLPAGPEP